MRLRGLPPWVLTPDEMTGWRGAVAGRWMHALTPLLYALSFFVAAAQGANSDHGGVGAIFPLTAIAVCLGVLPLARLSRRRVDAVSARSIYVGLASLTPWLIFAWRVDLRIDLDAGGGGALGNSVLAASLFFLWMVLPITLHALGARPVARARRGLVEVVAGFILVLAIVGATCAASRRDVDALRRYRLQFAGELHPWRGADARLDLHGLRVALRPHGDRCVTEFYGGEGLRRTAPHRCDAPIHVYWSHDEATPRWFSRPLFLGVFFVAVEDEVIPSVGSARFLLCAAPPWEWVACALLGACLGLTSWRRVRRVTASWRALPLREGEVVDGCVRCDDGTVVALAVEGARRGGRVVVLGDPALAAAFRDAWRGGCLVLPCTRGDWARSLDEAESVAQSFALAVMLLPSAPLLASPLLGMLSPLP